MSSFPASKYSRYKRATAFFLDWLLRARGRGRYASKRLDLDAFSAVVSDIAQDPSILTPKLLQDLPKALGACQCAITLREHVAVFFDDKEQGHLHFLSRLRNWLDMLKQIQVRQVPIQEEIRKFANYYQVLQVDEDYFPDDERFVKDKGVTNKSKAERKRLFDEAFAQDLQLEVVCYFMELEELMEGVFDIYQQVKKQEKTMMEATVVGTLALRIANQLTATLQLRYPALKSAEELVGVLLCYPSTSLGTQMAKAVEERRAKFDKEGTMSFVPWTLLHDFTNIWATLSMLVPIFPPIEPIEAAQLVALPDGYFGVNYGEERTPEYVFADPNHCVVLLAQQMPMLYNSIAHKRVAMGPGYKGQSGLVVDFMSAMETYFENRQVTIQLVFLCLCWMQSVAALQGEGGLSRNICLSINHTENLIRILNTSLPKHSPRVNRDSFHALMKDIMHGYEASLRTNNLAPANPLFAGSQMMSNHLEYLIIGNGHFVSLCGAFCHLYNALVQEGFLGPIPFFDEMLVVYEEMIFNPSSRAKAVHGSYNRIYLLSSRYSGASIDSTYDSASAVRKRATKWRDPDPNQHSLTYRFMHDDMSFLKGASSKTMLKNAADVCSKELFETRILSRDLLTLNDDLIDVFSELCHALGRDVVFDEYMAGGWDAPTPQEVKLSRSLEHAVMLPLMALLDALQPDGSIDSSAVPAEIQMTVECLVDGELIQQMCSSVAAVIKARFGNSQICEQRYFTFPSTPDLVNREYGSMSFKLKTKNGKREQIFSDLMKLMKSRSGPLTGSDLSYLKSEIKKDPELLGMFSRNPESIDHTKCDDLCTLLHQAAAGTARDVKLVEWLIQMGALFTQPMHCRKEPRQRDLACPRNLLPNTMAIHSAVIVGHHAIVKVLLEADNLVDINTLTYHTKETIAHLAVKNGHKTLYYGIQGYGADVRILDGKGRRVCELTTDRKWSREIAQIAARIELSCSLGRGRCEPPGLFEGALTRLAAHTRKSVFSQRDDERQRALDVLTANSPVKSKKKKTAKKGVKGKVGGSGDTGPTSPPTIGTAATNGGASPTSKVIAVLVGSTELTNNANGSSKAPGRDTALHESIQKTTAAFAGLRDPNISAADKVNHVEHICKVIERLDESTEVQADPNKMIGTGVLLRTHLSFEATQVIHMMQKFYRADHPAHADPVLDHIREFCATTKDFVNFVVHTAWISISVDRKSQASEVMDVLEKRLLKTPFAAREPPNFREMVQMYSIGRNSMRLGRASTPDALSRLEWYLNSLRKDKQQEKLDKIVGRPCYFSIALSSGASDRLVSEFTTAVGAVPELDGVACVGKRVVYGGTSKDDLAKVRDLVLEIADQTGVQVVELISQFCILRIMIGPFEFSAAGALRSADAA